MKTLIAVPCMGTVPTEFMNSLMALRRVGETITGTTDSALIYDARDILAQQAIEYGADRILWLDSDMVFRPDLMERLSADMDDGHRLVSGLYFRRVLPTRPVIYKRIRPGAGREEREVLATPYDDYPEDSIFEIAGCGFGAMMMETRLYLDIREQFLEPFAPMWGLGEDLAFCFRAGCIGATLYCDSRVKVGHVGKYIYDETDFERGGLNA